MRIINIVENLDKGAVENWLVNIFVESRKSRPDWQWTFYCLLGKEGRLDQKVIAAGGKIIYSTNSVSKKIKFLKELRHTLKHGNYDIIHSHHDFLSGFYLLASSGIIFKKRILQIHNTDESLPVGNKLLQNLLLGTFRLLAIRYSDLVIGISKHVLETFLKNSNLKKKKSVVLYYGIDMQPFSIQPDILAFRSKLGIPHAGKIMLFIGRMNSFKNPVFVVEILNEILKSNKNYYALFVGEGDCAKEVIETGEKYGITDHIRMLGWRNDQAAIMKAVDYFVFPRKEIPKEGLGLVVVEAQAAGLPMILSNGIPEDAIEIPELAEIISLHGGVKKWALAILNLSRHIEREQALKIMESSKFSLPIATKNFIEIYESK